MTRDEALRLLPIIEAFAKGQQVNFRYKESEEWQNTSQNHAFSPELEYCIMPQPRECFILETQLNGKLELMIPAGVKLCRVREVLPEDVA